MVILTLVLQLPMQQIKGYLLIEHHPTRGAERQLFEMSYLGRIGQLEASNNHLIQSPFLERGWVLQECAMSRRMLSFTMDDVIWQCSASTATEDNPVVNPSEPYFLANSNTDHPFYVVTPNRHATRIGWVADTLRYRWFRALDHYVYTKPSFPNKDMLRAIEGISFEVSRLSGETFAHGTLSSTLLPSLLWRPPIWYEDGNNTPSRGPSWHWSSLDSKRGFHLALQS